MKITDKISTRTAALRTEAQEKKDAAGGEKIAAKEARATAQVHRDAYETVNAAGDSILREARELRAQAAQKVREAVGGRGLHALENVARGLAQLMNKLAGQPLLTTVDLKRDPEATAAAAALEQLAAQKEAQAQQKFQTAAQSWVRATEALTKAEGHEKTAAAHTAAAGKLLARAKVLDAGGDVAQTVASYAAFAGEAVMRELGSDVNKLRGGLEESSKKALRGLLGVGVGLLQQTLEAVSNKANGKPVTLRPERANAELRAGFAAAAAQFAADAKSAVADASSNPKVSAAAPSRRVVMQNRLFEAGKPAATTASASPAASSAGPSERLQRMLEDFEASFPIATNGQAAPPSNPSFATLVGRAIIEHEPPEHLDPFKPRPLGSTAELFAARDFGALGGKRPAIDTPPPGEKKISESLLAARWAAEAVGVDWSKVKSTGALKDLLAQHHHSSLGIKSSSSPFEVKARIMERLGLPLGKDRAAVRSFDADTLRRHIDERAALGLPRLAHATEVAAVRAQDSVLVHGMMQAPLPPSSSPRLTAAGASVRQGVVDAAHQALGADTFRERNDVHAEAVGKEAALLAAHCLSRTDGNPGIQGDFDWSNFPSLQRASRFAGFKPWFVAAAKEAGNAFAAAFTAKGSPPIGSDGKPTKEATDAYNAAMKAAGGIALDALRELDPQAVAVIRGANLGDIAALVARDLGVDAAVLGQNLKTTLAGLKETALKDDYYKALLDTPLNDKASLDAAGLNTLALAVRMANCTWRSGQVHRAAWEGNDSRIDPTKRGGVYNPFDFLVAEKFHANGGDTKAFALTVFEIYKDLDKLKRAA